MGVTLSLLSEIVDDVDAADERTMRIQMEKSRSNPTWRCEWCKRTFVGEAKWESVELRRAVRAPLCAVNPNHTCDLAWLRASCAVRGPRGMRVCLTCEDSIEKTRACCGEAWVAVGDEDARSDCGGAAVVDSRR